MSCTCDTPPGPAPPRAIPAGRDTIARQPGTFAEHRRALLAAASVQPGLRRWRARSDEEYGVLGLELWAYVLDVVGLYDSNIASEHFVSTARLPVSLQRLVALLGYVPRPAVAASVALAALASGPDPVTLPAGTGFRSAALPGGGPPQVFELDAETVVERWWNGWPLAPVRPATLPAAATATVLLDPRGVALVAGDIVLATRTGGNRVVVVSALAERVETDGATYLEATFDREPGLPAGTATASVALLRPTRAVGLWKLPRLGSDPEALDLESPTTKLVLDGLHRDVPEGERLIVSKGTDHRWFSVAAIAEVQRTLLGSLTSELKDNAGDVTGSVVSPAVTVPATVLTLDTSINAADRKRNASDPDWVAADAASLVVRAGLLPAARLTLPLRRDLAPGDLLVVDGPVVPPRSGALPGRFLLAPSEGEGADVTGVLDPASRTLTPDAATAPAMTLEAPVEAHANVVAATRGETVALEVLGTGDATATHQRFTLAKKPLTYVPAAGTELGARSTLQVRINGRLWLEVPTFFGAVEQDEVFIVRPREDGGSDVVFGGFGRGAPLPTGATVTASYRFGAGAEMPPARSITQFARPVPGLAQLRNPVRAWGGADAEASESVRRYAPRSALLLGRAVSMADMEAAAAGAPGVSAARAEWRWSATRQRPVVHIAYIGDSGVAGDLVRLVRSLTDPTTPVEVEVSDPEPHVLALDVAVDAALEPATVAEAVRAALADGDEAPLAPTVLGVGGPLFRSVLFSAVLDVPGAVAVQGVTLDAAPWDAVALVPADGSWLDLLEAGELQVSGTVAA